MTTVAIQGERGAFSHAAALRTAPGATILPCRSFDDLFEAVTDGRAELGMVPVENTLAGSVQRAMDLLVQHRLHAVAEARIPIRLCLAVRPGTILADVTAAASHPVALQQCHGFFRAHPRIASVAAYDTAGSVKDLMAGVADWNAAIGSALAAELYGARILLEDLEDDRHNFTRFLAVSRTPGSPPEVGAKTSIAFSLPHTPGSLFRALECLSKRGVDLSRIESRPIPGHPWEYRFYVDLRGVDLTTQRSALAELAASGTDVRVLGSYPETSD
jgi:prephenate dehydratase